MAATLEGKTRYPFYRRLGGPQDRSGRAKNLVPTGIRSRTVQPVVSHYTDWATRPTIGLRTWVICVDCEERNFYTIYIKVKWSGYRPGVAQRVGRGIALLFHDRGTRRSEGSAARPVRTLPLGKTRYPFYRRFGEPQGRSGQVRKFSPPPEFDPRTVQPVVSHYTDWATRPTDRLEYI